MDICRYMSFKRFCQLMFNQELTLVPPSFWDDKFESYLSQVISTEIGNKLLKDFLKGNYQCDDKMIKTVKDYVLDISNHTRGICFSKKVDEEQLWQAYSKDNMTVMITTSKEKLMNLDTSGMCSVADVKYDLNRDRFTFADYLLLLNVESDHEIIANYQELFLHKRDCFQYEDEVRLLIKDVKDEKCKPYPIKICDLSNFITDVKVHPVAEPWFESTIQTICEKCDVHFSGKSKIYTLDEDSMF